MKKPLKMVTLIVLLPFLYGCSAVGVPDRTASIIQTATTTITQTPTPEPSETPNPTSSPTLTPTPPHPLTMQWLREQDYPASEIVIEETLDPGPNYERYIVSYTSEGLKINALLTIPYGENPEDGWPVIIFNHGYIPPDQYRTTERYVAYVNSLASNGYIVFRPDYRGHADSEGIARGAYSNPDYVVDVLNAVAAIKVYEDADPERIGMWGHSMGGYITLRAMLTDPDIQAGVIWAGVVASYPDLIERWRRSGSASPTPRPGSWRGSLSEQFGAPDENPVFWDSISANTYLGELEAPIQLHHGTKDTSVPFEFSSLLYDQILTAGGSAEFYEYQGDDHNLSNGFSTAMQRSINFFHEHIRISK